MPDAFQPPGHLPDGFPLRTAIRCGHLVDAVYAFYQQWSDAGKPPAETMRFEPVRAGRSALVFTAPFWRTLSYRKPVGAGARSSAHRRFQQVVEHTPAGACAVQGKRLYIVFRGTLGAAEKITTLMASRQDAVFDDLEGGGVHRGFHQCYASVREAVMKFIRDGIGPDKTVRVIGYSLGGALACLAAMDIATYGLAYRKLEVFAFGSPLVGSAKWARHYKKQRIVTWRMANEHDLVTKVPPAIFGYRHVGTPIVFASPGGVPPHSLAHAYLPALRAARDACAGRYPAWALSS